MDASPTPATPLRIAGTSAGAVGAVLAALQAAGEPLERAADVTRSLDYHRFRDSGRVGRLLGPLGFLADGASLPFFFEPVQMPTPRGTSTLVVGGLLSNYPLGIFDRVDGRPASWPTLGIRLTSRLGEPRCSEPVRGPPA